MRNRVFYLALAVLLCCAVTAPAQERGKAKKPHRLPDSQLNRITAGDSGAGSSGQDLGGAIVAAGSEATITNSGAVTLEDSTQKGAQALNLVNSSQSRVANGVNVWDGRLDTQNGATQLNVDQKNQVFQQGFATYASLSEYKRTDRNVSTSYKSSESSKSASSDSFTNDSMVDTRQTIGSNGSSSSGDGSSPVPSLDIKAGQGIAGTGKLDIHVDAGSVNIGVSAGTKVTAERDGTFATLKGSASADFNANLTWDLPKLDVSFDGGICYVELGVCSAKGSRDSSSSSESSKEETYSQTVHAPVTIRNAKAEYIVVDESKLTAKNDYTVFLSGNSQADAKAMNLVNAAGSLITNAVNVARTPTVGPVINLNQTNLIVQQH